MHGIFVILTRAGRGPTNVKGVRRRIRIADCQPFAVPERLLRAPVLILFFRLGTRVGYLWYRVVFMGDTVDTDWAAPPEISE